MFEYAPGKNVVHEGSDLIVNTVNTVGVMGKGVALAFKNEFPQIMEPYQAACKSGRLQPGAFQLIPLEDGRTVLNLATKEHWRADSKSEWIGSGFLLLARYIEKYPEKFGSISMPPPGCGNGGLSWDRVHQTALSYLTPASDRGMLIRFLSECPEPVDEPTYVAGIGARATPSEIQALMADVGAKFSENDWILRSGGAVGADSAFGMGAAKGGNPGEIYLTEKGLGDNGAKIPGSRFDTRPVHRKTVGAFHPRPEKLKGNGFELMARNACQLFGPDMEVASKLVICWTKDGKLDGGTAQALRMADCTGIPVINLGLPDLQGITADKVIELGQELIAARTAVLRDRPSLDQSPSPA